MIRALLKVVGGCGMALVIGAAPMAAQTEELARRIESYVWHSGVHDGSAGVSMAYDGVIAVAGAPWIQLRFSMAALGRGSYLQIISVADGATQHLDAKALRQWRNRSAYFNGEAVQVRLFVAAQDRNVAVAIEEVVVGEWGQPSTKTICGTDDRVASTEPRVARIDPQTCTAWIASNGKILTAGHCLSSAADILSFNPPASLANGTVQFPGPEDQYAVDPASLEGVGNGVGDDWGFLAVADNTETGLQPFEAQGAFAVRQDNNAATLRITGFGFDDGATNRTNQTQSGPNAGSSGSTLRYAADTMGGNSGSPVIDEATGEAVGIHTHGGCSVSGGSNAGTSFFNANLWAALDIENPTLFADDFESGGTDGWDATVP